MQYILTEDEYLSIKNHARDERDALRNVLQDLCTKVADNMSIYWGWGVPEDPKPWGCILTKTGGWYCDKCPVKKVCPHESKRWSK